MLRQIGVEPDLTEPASLDETPQPREIPRQLARRLAAAKVVAVSARHTDAHVLAADTVVALGRRILPKAADEAEVRRCVELLSGRAHRVITAVAAVAPNGREAARVVETRVRFKRLSDRELAAYAACGEGVGKAGGYAIQGRAGALVMSLQGSFSAVVGLPLYETANLLTGLGYRLP